MIFSVLVAGAVPHIFKLLVRRRRPDRSIQARKNGISRSGNAWDSFPSGHAVHLGAMAPSATKLVSPATPEDHLACLLVAGLDANSDLGALSKRRHRGFRNWRSDQQGDFSDG
jgi:hypothetical protein